VAPVQVEVADSLDPEDEELLDTWCGIEGEGVDLEDMGCGGRRLRRPRGLGVPRPASLAQRPTLQITFCLFRARSWRADDRADHGAPVPRGFNCATCVSQFMSTDTDGSGDGEGSTKIDVRVPTHLIEQIDEEYAERGYTSRSEAIRDALRAWVDPPVRLSEEFLEDLAVSREQRERGETRSLDEVAEKYGVDIDEA